MLSNLDKLFALTYSNLIIQAPVMSGNMKSHIQVGKIEDDEIEIIISAPFYDVNKWKKTKEISYTRESYNGITDYANWVNELGGFARHNDSEHWANRVLYDSAQAIATEIGGEVINELQL